jgi:electron transfer flavoprotein alpha subunit
MKAMPENPEVRDIWILTEHREGTFTGDTFGLVNEARKLISKMKQPARITAVLLGRELPPDLETLGDYGVDRLLCLKSDILDHYHGERFAGALFRLIERHAPNALLAAQSADTADLCARLGGLLETGVATHAMDLKVENGGKWIVTRPVANGYLFEETALECDPMPVVSFVPAVLSPAEKIRTQTARVEDVLVEDPPDGIKTEVVEVIEADPETLDIEEADIIVSGGRGVGKGEGFDIIHELARVMGGSVAATRPIIDWHVLPYERQIGQTGKTVSPRLMINCGISGANEYTAGIENSDRVVAINTDPRARIFRFADLGLVADVHELLPLLISRIREIKDA